MKAEGFVVQSRCTTNWIFLIHKATERLTLLIHRTPPGPVGNFPFPSHAHIAIFCTSSNVISSSVRSVEFVNRSGLPWAGGD
jgi:hypothetical protein